MHAQQSSGASGLHFGLNINLCPVFVSVTLEDSDKAVWMCRFDWASATHICNKNLISWTASFAHRFFYITYNNKPSELSNHHHLDQPISNFRVFRWDFTR